MPDYIAFLRAVNIGNRQVKMERLRNMLSRNGFDDVRTHIASGNVRVTTPMRSAVKVEQKLREVISAEFGFDVPVIVRTPAQLVKLATDADVIESPVDDAARYVTLMTGTLDPDGITALEAWPHPDEGARIIGNDVVMFLRNGVGVAKMSNAKVEKLLRGTGTARNITVIRTLADKWSP